MSSLSSHRVKRGAAFTIRALALSSSLVAWDTSRPQVANARSDAPVADCRDEDALIADAGGLARPRRYQQPCNQTAPNNRPPQQRRCSDRAFNLLYAQVHKWCHLRERSCSPQADACEIIDKKIRSGYGCTNAREILQGQCYQSGDPGYQTHMGEIRSAYVSLRRCIDVQNDKCGR